MLLSLFLAFSLIIIVLYLFLIFSFYKGWISTGPFENINNPTPLFISVIIPFRNEEKNLPFLFRDLAELSIDTNTFEIIAIDDHSCDSSAEIAELSRKILPCLNLIHLKENQNGKKDAITEAVRIAKGDLIVIIDADCRVGKYWLACISSFFTMYKPDMIIMPVMLKEQKTFPGRIMAMEFMSLIASGAGAAGIQKPIMCNGANIAYKKSCFLQYDDPLQKDSASGDDIFFMSKIKKAGGNIVFLKSASVMAFTNGPSNLKEFLSQRKRWTSKSRFYNDVDIIITAIIVFMTSFILCFCLLGAFFNSFLILVFLILFCLKSIADWVLLSSFAKFFKQKKLLKYFFPSQAVYFFYITFMVIYGNIGKYQWKERKL